MEQVSPHVYIAADRGACTVGAIKTSEGVVLVDSPNRATGAVTWRQEISGLGPVRYLINTEHHVDHVFGNHFLPGVVIANHYTKANFYQAGFHGKDSKLGLSRLLDPEGYMKDEDPAGVELLADYKPREPEISFHGRLTLRLADITIEVFETPGHMPANSVVYVKEDKVLFTGDNVFNGVMTWFHECLPFEWIKTLERLSRMDVDVVVPGHGNAGGLEVIGEMSRVVEQATDRVQSAINSGMSRQEVLECVTFEDLQPVLKRLRHRLPGLQQTFVGRIHDQIQKHPS